MIISLGEVFDVRLSESAAKAIIAGAAAGYGGRTLSQFLIGWIPLYGNALNSTTAFAMTEALGWFVVEHFCSIIKDDKDKYKDHGEKEGYERASAEYEQKLRDQAEHFAREDSIKKDEIERLKNLLKEYEDYIAELERECASKNSILEWQQMRDTLAKKLKNIE